MIIIKDIFGSIIVKTYLQHMLEITGKVLGAMTHVLSFCLVSCFCFLFIYFTDYTMFTLIASRHKPTVSSWIVDCAIALVLMYFGLNVFFNYFMTMLTDPGTPFNDDPELLNVNLDPYRSKAHARNANCPSQEGLTTAVFATNVSTRWIVEP